MPRMLNIFHVDCNYVCLRPDYLRRWLKRLAELGFNAILWELEDKVRWEVCPECVWPEAMSKEEFRRILRLSRELGLEPIPLLQTIGHGEYVLRHERYHSLRELPEHYDCYCTSNPDVRSFLRAWVEEYLDLFGELRYFHLGGDEAYVFASCPRCAEAAAARGRNRLYAEHVTDLAAPILQRGARPGIWCDMVLQHPQEMRELPGEFVIWDWNYWGTSSPPATVRVWGKGTCGRDELPPELLRSMPEVKDARGQLQAFYTAKALKRLGYDVILCSASRSHGDNFWIPASGHAANIVGVAATVVREGLLGNCVTSWAMRLNDYVAQLPCLGLAAAALRAPARGSEELLDEWCGRFCGAPAGDLVRAVELLGVVPPFTESGSTAVGWDGKKGSVPAPPGYLHGYLEKLRQDAKRLADARQRLARAREAFPEAVRLLAGLSPQVAEGVELVEHLLAGARFLQAMALLGERVLAGERGSALARVARGLREEHAAFLRRRETPGSADKNAGLVFDPLVEWLDS